MQRIVSATCLAGAHGIFLALGDVHQDWNICRYITGRIVCNIRACPVCICFVRSTFAGAGAVLHSGANRDKEIKAGGVV